MSNMQSTQKIIFSKNSENIKLPQPIPPQESPLIFFLNLCSILFYVPFRVKWNPSTKRFTLRSNKLRCILCCILHLLVISYNIIMIADHFLNFKNLTGSSISACFIFVYTLAAALLWLLFMKLVWFDKDKLENVVNITISISLKGFYMKTVKSFVVLGGIIFAYFNFELVNRTLERFHGKDYIPLYFAIFKTFSL